MKIIFFAKNQIYKILKLKTVRQQADISANIKNILIKYYNDNESIPRRQFRNLIWEFYLELTPEEVIQMHQDKVMSPYMQKKRSLEKYLIKYMSQIQETKFTRKFTEELLVKNPIRDYIVDQVQSTIKETQGEQHQHQQDKKIYETVKESVKRIVGDDL